MATQPKPTVSDQPSSNVRPAIDRKRSRAQPVANPVRQATDQDAVPIEDNGLDVACNTVKDVSEMAASPKKYIRTPDSKINRTGQPAMGTHQSDESRVEANPENAGTSGVPSKNPDKTVQTPSPSLEFSVSEEDNLVRRFGRDAHDVGMEARRSAAMSITGMLATGRIIEQMFKREGGDRKSGSKYGEWCSHYLPWLGRKTCDRWRQAYVAFREFFDDPAKQKEFKRAWENLQLTTLYLLSQRDVPKKAREAALKVALRKRITPKQAEVFIEEAGGKLPVTNSTARRPQKAKLTTSASEVDVTIRYPKDSDKVAAIERAIKSLKAELAPK